MCTGDNLFTALSVARDCKMIDEHEKVILVDTDESKSEPTFTYAHMHNRRINEISSDSTVRL